VGNREDLLAAAKRCLYERGYGRTTARDIASAAGTSLASIGYHYRSTEALMNAAVIDAIGDWARDLESALSADPGREAGEIARFEAVWDRFTESFEQHRPVWAASLEVAGLVERVPGIREELAAALERGRLGLAQLFQGVDPAADPRRAHVVGSLYQALVSGVVVQWVVDPARAPSGRDLATALRLVVEGAVGPGGGRSSGLSSPLP
jgi:AcrR family transcriptional regulator